MKGFSKILVTVVALVMIAAVVFASTQPSTFNLYKLKGVGVGSQPGTIDTTTVFTVPICAAGASGAMASADTLQGFRIPSIPYTFSPAPGSDVIVNVARITFWGVPYLVTSDTLKAFLDLGPSANGPWLNASPTTLVNCIVAGGAGAADTTGCGYFKTYLVPLSTAANGGLTAYSGYVSIKADATSPTNVLGWNYARIRVAGDCTAPVYVVSTEVAFPQDVQPALRQ